MSLAFLWMSARKDLRRLLRDPVALLVWLGIPIVVVTLMNLVFGGSQGPKPQGRLLIADEDQSILSSVLGQAFTRGELATMITVENVTAEAGRRQIDAGEASALLTIPKGFSTAVLQATTTELRLLTNPTQRIVPGIIEETLSIVAEGAHYLRELIGDNLARFQTPRGAPVYPDAAIAVFSARINRLVAAGRRYLDPPLIRIRQEQPPVSPSAAQQAGGNRMAAAFLPGMLFLAIMFIAQSFSADIWKERLNGTLRRVLGTPQPAEAALGGKVMATALVLTAIGAVGLTCSVLIFQIPVARPALALVWIVTAGTALYLLMMCVQVLATSERAANVLASMLIFPLAMLGGSFFPFALMPGWLATIGRRTPNGWAVAQLHSLVEGSVTSATLPLSFAGAAIIAAGAFLFVARRVQQGFAF